MGILMYGYFCAFIPYYSPKFAGLARQVFVRYIKLCLTIWSHFSLLPYFVYSITTWNKKVKPNKSDKKRRKSNLRLPREKLLVGN